MAAEEDALRGERLSPFRVLSGFGVFACMNVRTVSQVSFVMMGSCSPAKMAPLWLTMPA